MKKESQNTNEDVKPGPGSGAIMVRENGVTREATQAEYDAEPRGRIFIGIGGFKPPAGKKCDPN
jgi:hypothetical protein